LKHWSRSTAPPMQRPFSGDMFSIRGGSEQKVDILGGNTIGHCEKQKLYERVSNSEWLSRDTAIWI